MVFVENNRAENVPEKPVFSITFPRPKIQYFPSRNYIRKDSLFPCLFRDIFPGEKGATNEVTGTTATASPQA